MECLCAFTTPHSITFISATNLTLDAFATNPVNLAFRQRDINKGVTTTYVYFTRQLLLLSSNQLSCPKKTEKKKMWETFAC